MTAHHHHAIAHATAFDIDPVDDGGRELADLRRVVHVVHLDRELRGSPHVTHRPHFAVGAEIGFGRHQEQPSVRNVHAHHHARRIFEGVDRNGSHFGCGGGGGIGAQDAYRRGGRRPYRGGRDVEVSAVVAREIELVDAVFEQVCAAEGAGGCVRESDGAGWNAIRDRVLQAAFEHLVELGLVTHRTQHAARRRWLETVRTATAGTAARKGQTR